MGSVLPLNLTITCLSVTAAISYVLFLNSLNIVGVRFSIPNRL